MIYYIYDVIYDDMIYLTAIG